MGHDGACPSTATNKPRSNSVPRQLRSLRLCVDADQRPWGSGLRFEVADETIFGADFNVPRGALGVINQDRSKGRFVRVAHPQFMEAVAFHQLLSCFLGISGFGIGADCSGGEQGLFYIMPALRTRVRVGPLLCDCGGAHQLWIDAAVYLSERCDNFLRLIFCDYIDRLRFTLRIFKRELRRRRSRESCGGEQS